MVITGRTRNAFDGNVTWVRIPPSPPRRNGLRSIPIFIYQFPHGHPARLAASDNADNNALPGKEVFYEKDFYYKFAYFNV